MQCFDDPNRKKIYSWKFFSFFYYWLQFTYLSLGFHTWTSKLQRKPLALKREHPALQNIKFFNFFPLLWVIFALLDPDPDPQTWLNPYQKHWFKGDFFCIFHCFIQHTYICHSWKSLSEDAGIKQRTIATLALAVRRSNHSARSHPLAARSHLHAQVAA